MVNPPPILFDEYYKLERLALLQGITPRQYDGPFERKFRRYTLSLNEEKDPHKITVNIKIKKKDGYRLFPIGVRGEIPIINSPDEPALISLFRSADQEIIDDILDEIVTNFDSEGYWFC